MATTYYCTSAGRRQAVRASTTINGIDFVEVDPTQTIVRVVFIHDLPGTGPSEVPLGAAPLTQVNVVVSGGVRVIDPAVVQVTQAANVLEVEVTTPGDFSTYSLHLVVGSGDADPPPGFDPRLSSVDFMFKATCPSEFDCATHQHCPPEERDEPEIDYLNKDYQSFRRLMLERLAVVTPDWRDRSAADLQITMVELLAYVGDQLSYRQDAAATEAYLGTARRRVSVRRHARFLDYFMHEGCNARAWLALEVDGVVNLPARTAVVTGARGDSTVIDPALLPRLVAETAPVVFETTADAVLRPDHHEIDLYTWSDDRCCLPTGSTAATLLNEPALTLAVGDVIVVEEVRSPTTGLTADADRTRRHAVRLTAVRAATDPVTGTDVLDVSWDEADALPFPLCVTTQIVAASGAIDTLVTSVARANIVLADHGYTLRDMATGMPQAELLGTVQAGRPFRPRLEEGPVTVRGTIATSAPVAETMTCDPRTARPDVRVDDGTRSWQPVFDLIASDRFEPEFVVEFETDRTAQLRFGDDVQGRAPTPGDALEAWYRIGSGRAGNVGADRLSRVAFAGPGSGDLVAVRNPLPAAGGTEPESMSRVRYAAPQAMRTPRRAVTEQDYATMAGSHPAVQRAKARFRWTGSWYTVFVSIDPVGTTTVDEQLENDLLTLLDGVRMMGHDLEITQPEYVPLDAEFHVCVTPGYSRSDVRATLVEVLGNRRLPEGTSGLFHPDNFSFGDPVYLSRIYEAALGVPGVSTVTARRFQRMGEVDRGELDAAVLQPDDREIARLDNDPSFPEMGHLELVLEGGL